MYFSLQDHHILDTVDPTMTPAYHKFLRLQEQLTAEIENTPFELHVVTPISNESVSTRRADDVLALQYGRSETTALSVERRMGSDESQPEVRRHATIELRISQAHFAVELILSPDAWWDQQNLVGKLMVDRHRQSFYKKVQALAGSYRLGFWQGVTLNDMHLTAENCRWVQVLDEWLGTFEPGKDWFRVGVWYEPEASTLAEDRIVDELLKQIKCLYSLYQHLLWKSDNNYHSFYQKLAYTSY